MTFVFIQNLNAQTAGIAIKSIVNSNLKSINLIKEHDVLNVRNVEINNEDISYVTLSISDPKLTNTELTALYNKDGSFRNLSYHATIIKGQTFDYNLLFKVCGIDSNFFISEKHKSEHWIDLGTVYFPKDKLKANFLIEAEKNGSITCNLNIFRATEEEIQEALKKTAGQPTLQFTLVNIVGDNDNLIFQNIPLGSPLWSITEELEPYLPSKLNGDLVFVGEGKIINLPCSLIFQFHESVFFRGGYILTNSYINDNTYNSDFERLEKLLSEKYGSPTINKDNWSTDLLKGKKENIGLAISSGQLERVRHWDLGKYRIILKINGEKFKIKTVLFYELKDIAEKSNKNIQNSLLEEL
jgi:hypothetical protein